MIDIFVQNGAFRSMEYYMDYPFADMTQSENGAEAVELLETQGWMMQFEEDSWKLCTAGELLLSDCFQTKWNKHAITCTDESSTAGADLRLE